MGLFRFLKEEMEHSEAIVPSGSCCVGSRHLQELLQVAENCGPQGRRKPMFKVMKDDD